MILTGTICDTTTTSETTTNTTPQVTSTLTTSIGTTPCPTLTKAGNSNGAMCVFPFVYQGIRYYECTVKDSTVPWCATTSDYDADKLWGNCAGM